MDLLLLTVNLANGRPVFSSERAFHVDKRATAPDGARHQDRLTDRQSQSDSNSDLIWLANSNDQHTIHDPAGRTTSDCAISAYTRNHMKHQHILCTGN
jgi:hypothetical protein